MTGLHCLQLCIPVAYSAAGCFPQTTPEGRQSYRVSVVRGSPGQVFKVYRERLMKVVRFKSAPRRVADLFYRFQRNIREDEAFVSSCKDTTALAILEEQLHDVLLTLDRIKGMVR